MKKSKLALQIVLLILVITGCKSKTVSSLNESNLHSNYTKIWKLSTLLIDGEQNPTDYDVFYTFNKNNSGIVTKGIVNKAHSDSLHCDFIDWYIENEYLIFKDFFNHRITNITDGMVSFKIVSLSEDSLILERYDSNNSKITEFYLPLVKKNISAPEYNIALTNGLSKIWRASEIFVNSGDFVQPEHRKDDFWIFNTDGTGFFSHGENKLNHDEYTDFFHWSYNKNENKLHTEFFEHSNLVIRDRNVIELTPEEFVFDGYFMIDNQKTDYRKIVMKPVLSETNE